MEPESSQKCTATEQEAIDASQIGEIPSRYKTVVKKLVVQRGCRIYDLEGCQDSSRQGPVKPDPVEPVLCKGLDYVTFQRSLPT